MSVLRKSPFDGATRKGYQAGIKGKPIDSCPYRDLRTDRGCVTFSRGFRTAWRNGWREGSAASEKALAATKSGDVEL